MIEPRSARVVRIRPRSPSVFDSKPLDLALFGVRHTQSLTLHRLIGLRAWL